MVQSYFETDCLWINKQCEESPDTFASVGIFVLMTIQRSFSRMPIEIADFQRFGTDSRFVYGYKRNGIEYIRSHKRELWEASQAYRQGKLSLADLIQAYMAVPGLGITKASFLAQMTVGNGVCLDTNNLQRLGLKNSTFNCSKNMKPEMIAKRIAVYLKTCDTLGNSAFCWDSWCDFIANATHNKRGNAKRHDFPNSAIVSALHRIAVTAKLA